MKILSRKHQISVYNKTVQTINYEKTIKASTDKISENFGRNYIFASLAKSEYITQFYL